MFIHQHTPPLQPQSRGRREWGKDYAAGPDQAASARVGGCVSGYAVLPLTAQAPSCFPGCLDDSILQGSPSPKGPKATPFSYFPGSPSRVSTFFSLISGSDIRDRREKRLKVIMLL